MISWQLLSLATRAHSIARALALDGLALLLFSFWVGKKITFQAKFVAFSLCFRPVGTL